MKDKVLYIPGFNPFSTNGGGNQRCHLILKALQIRYDVDVIVDFEDVDNDYNPNLWDGINIIPITENENKNIAKRLLRSLNLIFNPATPELLLPTNVNKYQQVHDLIQRENYKWIITRYLFMVPYHRLYNLKNLIVDIDDIPYEKLKTSLILKHKTLTVADRFKIWKTREATFKVAQMAKITFLPDNDSRHYFPNALYLPNIPLLPKEELTRDAVNRIMFVGSMTQDMNFLGIDHFISNIWPGIIDKNPELELHIIGKGTPLYYQERWRSVKGIVMRGFVKDLNVEYSKAICAIAPIYSGAGTNIKVLEAIAHKCPIVVSDFAMRGFRDDFKDNESIMIAKNDTEFTDKVNLVVQDDILNYQLSKKGYSVIKNKYSFENFSRLLYKGIESI